MVTSVPNCRWQNEVAFRLRNGILNTASSVFDFDGYTLCPLIGLGAILTLWQRRDDCIVLVTARLVGWVRELPPPPPRSLFHAPQDDTADWERAGRGRDHGCRRGWCQTHRGRYRRCRRRRCCL